MWSRPRTFVIAGLPSRGYTRRKAGYSWPGINLRGLTATCGVSMGELTFKVIQRPSELRIVDEDGREHTFQVVLSVHDVRRSGKNDETGEPVFNIGLAVSMIRLKESP